VFVEKTGFLRDPLQWSPQIQPIHIGKKVAAQKKVAVTTGGAPTPSPFVIPAPTIPSLRVAQPIFTPTEFFWYTALAILKNSAKMSDSLCLPEEKLSIQAEPIPPDARPLNPDI
jgi:hypothetical protein